MSNPVIDTMLKRLHGREVMVWGARMTGMGFARFFATHGEEGIAAFIDSDPALQGKRVNGIPVITPQDLSQARANRADLMVVIAVALKEHEIIEMLDGMGFTAEEYLVYSEYCTDFYTIDVVGTCNLKCPSCAHGSEGMEAPLGLMPFEQFTQVVDKAVGETAVASHMSLYSWGEPLLHPQLGTMVEYLHQNGIAAAVSSNLSIRQEKPLRKLIQASPEYLKVSISGYYPEAYDVTHTGGDINLVKSNLYRLRYLIDRHQANTLVDVNYHLYTNNCGTNLKKMEVLCEELGFSLSTSYALVMPQERVIGHCQGEENPQLDALRKLLLVDIDEAIAASSGVEMEGCPFRDNQTNINWDLTMPVCCTVFNRNPDILVSENYLQSSIEEISQRKQQIALCKQCMALGLPAYNMGFNRGQWEKIASTKMVTDG